MPKLFYRPRAWLVAAILSSPIYLAPPLAMAAAVPTVSLSSNIEHASLHASVAFTAHGNHLPPGAEYQFWVQNPTGHWSARQNYSPSNQFVLPRVNRGNYTVAVDVMTPSQIRRHQWSNAIASPSIATFVGSQVSLSPLSSAMTDVKAGSPVTVRAQSQNIYHPLFQFWYEGPGGHWHQSGNYNAAAQFTFNAPSPGRYHVVAFAKSPADVSNGQGAMSSQQVLTVGAFGKAAQVLVQASHGLVADGHATSNVRVKVADMYGNRVKNFSGMVDLADTHGLVPYELNGDHNDVRIVHGQGAFQLGPVTHGGWTDTISADSLSGYDIGQGGSGNAAQSTNVSYGHADVMVHSAAAAGLSLGAQSGTISNNQVASDAVTIGLLDGANYSYTTIEGRYVKVSLSGPGSFSPDANLSTEVIYVHPGTSEGRVTIYSQQGVSGTISLSASSAGLQSAHRTVLSGVNTAPASLLITHHRIAAGGLIYTRYTIREIGSNHVPITTGLTSKRAVTISDNTARLHLPQSLQFWYGAGINANSTLPYGASRSTPSGPNAEDKATTVANPVVFTASLHQGKLSFDVANGQNGSSPVNLTITSGPLRAVAPYRYQVGTPYAAVVNPYAIASGSALVGSSITVTAQLVDRAQNAIHEAGIPLQFQIANTSPWAAGVVSFPNGANTVQDQYQALTNSQGVATVTLHVPSSAAVGNQFQVAAAGPGQVNHSQIVNDTMLSPKQYTPTYHVVAPADYVSQLAWNHTRTVTVTAGGIVSGWTFRAENALAGGVSTTLSKTGAYWDTFLISSSNAQVASVASGQPGITAVAPGKWILSAPAQGGGLFPQLATSRVGGASMTLTDISNPTQPSITRQIVVDRGPRSGLATVWVNGAPVSGNNPLVLRPNVPLALHVVNGDSQGNPLAVTGLTALELRLPSLPPGVYWQTTQGGAPTSTVRIVPGASMAEVYLVAQSSQTISILGSAKDIVTQYQIAKTSQGLRVSAMDLGHRVPNAQPAWLSYQAAEPTSDGTGDSLSPGVLTVNGSPLVANSSPTTIAFAKGQIILPYSPSEDSSISDKDVFDTITVHSELGQHLASGTYTNSGL